MTFPWLSSKPLRIAVIGDVILDEYLEGTVKRISPEAPIPVHHVQSVVLTAGGAANVARNLNLVGSKAYLFSVCGKDESARELLKLLAQDAVNADGIFYSEHRPTVKKTRVTAQHQQMLRIDWEETAPISQKEQQQLFLSLQKEKFDAVLVSDYGKGLLPEELLQQIFAYTKSQGLLSVVDPKGKDFHKYQGCDVITPNRKEALEALGIPDESDISPEQLGLALQETYSLKHVLVTVGPQGMIFVPEKSSGMAPIHKKARAREVFDVSGAGDTVVALLTLCLAAKSSFEEAVDIANMAAGVVVGKWGTQPIRIEELQHAYERHHEHDHDHEKMAFSTSDKIKTRDALSLEINGPRTRGNRSTKWVFTNGCFDLLHAGHLTYLQKARALGDKLIVGVNTDESVSRLKGAQRPYVPLAERMLMLSGLSCIDYVVPFSEDTPKQLISELVPDILVKGADYQISEIVGADVVQRAGGQVLTIDLVPGLSSSGLVAKIQRDKS